VRQEEDTNFDGVVDRRSATGTGGGQVQEADTNGDGKIDTWLTLDSAGNVVQKQEDKDGDGKPDVTIKIKDGKPVHLEETKNGCVALIQDFDAVGNVVAEQKDTNGDCKIDTWTYLENGVVVRQGQDTQGRGKPDVLTVFGADGKPQQQELISDAKHKRPDKRLFLDANGQVTGQCVDTRGNGTFDARAIVENGAVTQVLIDTKGKGWADQREIYKDGQRVGLEADTNHDHKVDVIQTFENGQLVRQDEDTNFDGVIDRSFAGGKPAPVPADPKIQSPPFTQLDCGRISDFWNASR